VLRELGFAVRRFNDTQRNIGAPRETLSLRLDELEAAGVVERRRYSEHLPREEYFLTAAGEAMAPILRGLRERGEGFATPAITDKR
jgi:DNA-binding HxlR family transcriptional regulator